MVDAAESETMAGEGGVVSDGRPEAIGFDEVELGADAGHGDPERLVAVGGGVLECGGDVAPVGAVVPAVLADEVEEGPDVILALRGRSDRGCRSSYKG